MLLRELGRRAGRYNAFDLFRDGNAIKRYLSANGWLVYWLTSFGKRVEDFAPE